MFGSAATFGSATSAAITFYSFRIIPYMCNLPHYLVLFISSHLFVLGLWIPLVFVSGSAQSYWERLKEIRPFEAPPWLTGSQGSRGICKGQ